MQYSNIIFVQQTYVFCKLATVKLENVIPLKCCHLSSMSFIKCAVQSPAMSDTTHPKTIQLNSIQFIQWSQMHAQQSFINVCTTAIPGYHGDKIILYKNIKNIKCHKLQVIKLSDMSRSLIILL